MKLTQVMFAAAALVAATQAQADVARLTGASASLTNVVLALKSACVTAGGTEFKVYNKSSDASKLANIVTATCDADMDGAGTTEVRINVSGGSENSVINATAGGAVPAPFLRASDCGSAAVLSATSVVAPLSTGIATLYNCSAANNDTSTSDGGLSDVEGPVFSANYDGGDFQSMGISQVFGVVVNATLYNDLQAHQKTAAGGNIVPATCAAGATTAACQPSLSRAQITSLMNSDVSSDAKTLGGAYLVPGQGSKQIEYCARPQTSGTQQSAQLYFLGRALTGALGGAELLATYGTSNPKYAISNNSGSSNVRTCLNNTTGYKFGVLSAENNPLTGTDTFRFVRVNEVAAAEGVDANDTNTKTAIAGRYDFVMESVKFCPAGTCHPILDAISTEFGNLGASATPGLFLTGVESKFGRNGNNAAPYITR
jgi:hypothetical protein